MAKPKGARKTGGRKPGTPNKSTLEIKSLAQLHAADALEELVRLATQAENEATRVSAIKEILDRAYGKSPQALTGENGGPIQHHVGVSWMTESQAKARGWA